MPYTVKKLAGISGVSPRTLRFYDEIGLLKPAFYGDNQYRYYEEEQLLMLQQILFFRELGMPLSDIRRILSSDDFDKIESLKTHKSILQSGLERTETLIKTMPDDVEMFADCLGINKFSIVGHSGGAPFVAACAYKIPYRLYGTAIVSGPAPF